MAVGVAAQDAGIDQGYEQVEEVALVDLDDGGQPGQGARTKGVERFHDFVDVHTVQDRRGAGFLGVGGLGSSLRCQVKCSGSQVRAYSASPKSRPTSLRTASVLLCLR